MVLEDDEILFTNFTYNPDYYYFLYVGELKTYSLNYFVQEALAHRIPNRPIRFISMIPDVCIQYNYANIIVINPFGDEELITDHSFVMNGKEPRHSWRIDTAKFMSAVSNSRVIRSISSRMTLELETALMNLAVSILQLWRGSLPFITKL